MKKLILILCLLLIVGCTSEAEDLCLKGKAWNYCKSIGMKYSHHESWSLIGSPFFSCKHQRNLDTELFKWTELEMIECLDQKPYRYEKNKEKIKDLAKIAQVVEEQEQRIKALEQAANDKTFRWEIKKPNIDWTLNGTCEYSVQYCNMTMPPQCGHPHCLVPNRNWTFHYGPNATFTQKVPVQVPVIRNGNVNPQDLENKKIRVMIE